MIFKHSKANRAVRLKEVPELSIGELSAAIAQATASGKRVIGFFGDNEAQGSVRVYAVLADDDASEILLASCIFSAEKKYRAMTPDVPQMHMFERELYEQTGIMPEGHPWLKPVRMAGKYEFFKSTGEEIHEVAVGPVHAGVIEPGHFRFMCAGEKVQHLEIKLGYQHRGVEKMFETGNGRQMPALAESITGDTSIGHAMAYASVLEALSGAEVSRRAHVIRAIALELERAAMHAGGLGAIANDIAYFMGNAVCGANRTTLINTSLLITGSRFGRGLVRPGGVAYDIDAEKAGTIARNTVEACARIGEMAEEMFLAASVMSRLQETGVVTKKDAEGIGMTGFAARASGVHIDSRADHPFGAYVYYPVTKNTLESGDVFARAYLRHLELQQSACLITEMCESLPAGKIMDACGSLMPEAIAVSIVEGWRGGIVHAAITDKKGIIKRFKIKDPSFNNWFGLALAVRDNGISDFPLVNKSFDLSYCGNDL